VEGRAPSGLPVKYDGEVSVRILESPLLSRIVTKCSGVWKAIGINRRLISDLLGMRSPVSWGSFGKNKQLRQKLKIVFVLVASPSETLILVIS